MENNYIRRNQDQATAHSPRLMRSKSGAPNMSVLQSSALTPNSIVHRSKSTTKHRAEDLIGILSRSNRYHNAVRPVDAPKTPKRTKAVPSSPSAWALSPGRSPNLDSPRSSIGGGKVVKSGGGGGGVSVSGVLKYFRSKKAYTVEEGSFHRYRMMHTRLVQWRMVNARAENSIAARNSLAQKKLFNVWLRNWQMQNSVMEKRIELQKLKQESKLYQIINPQVHLLGEWTKIEKRNVESVSKLARNFSTLSIKLSFVEGAKGEMSSVYKVMCEAVEVMTSIEANISKAFFQVEEASIMLNELMMIVGQEREGIEELKKTIELVASLKVQEESLRVHLLQAENGSVREV